jgi:DnaJ-class molecular chaperone
MSEERTEKMEPGDEVPPDRASAAPDVCPRCEGSGEVDGQRCQDCGGTGTIEEAVGGG